MSNSWQNIAITMGIFLPSETARLILSYLLENEFKETGNKFMDESPHIQVYLCISYFMNNQSFLGIKMSPGWPSTISFKGQWKNFDGYFKGIYRVSYCN